MTMRDLFVMIGAGAAVCLSVGFFAGYFVA